MPSKKLEQKISALYTLVSDLDLNMLVGEDDSCPAKGASNQGSVQPSSPAAKQPASIFYFARRSFSTNGKLSRLYFVVNTAILLVSIGLVKLAIEVYAVVGSVVGLILLVLIAWSFIATAAQRWRDTGYSMWLLWTLLFPYVNFVTLGFLFFAPAGKVPVGK